MPSRDCVRSPEAGKITLGGGPCVKALCPKLLEDGIMLSMIWKHATPWSSVLHVSSK